MNRRTTLGLELLELRVNPVLSVSPSQDTLFVESDGDGDVAQVLSNGSGYLQVQKLVGGVWKALPEVYPGIIKVVFIGRGGDDTFVNETDLPLVGHGGAGNDEITGGGGDDRLSGDRGNDTLRGRGGFDKLWGDVSPEQDGPGVVAQGEAAEGSSVSRYNPYWDYVGNDVLSGGSGDDILYGGVGDDTLYGGSGADYLSDPYANDVNGITYTFGTNKLYGGSGEDTLVGGPGEDSLDGGQDGIADHLTGDFGADTFVRESYLFRGVMRNRDTPTDYSSVQGDTMIDPPSVWVLPPDDWPLF